MASINLINELRWRGMYYDATPGTEELLGGSSMVTGYIGFDPTAHSLHIGNLATLMLLVHLQRAGHKPIALVGGATGMVGDPTGKSAERNLLDEEVLRYNQAGITAQLKKFLSFEGANAAEVVNNYDWFKDFSFLGFLRDVGKHLTVNYMLAKDSVQKRLEFGLSFTEFSYQLLQGYDYYHLYQHKNARLQMGGSDQWGNITAGTELIRRIGGGEAYALTTPLITKADGTKFGKSEGGNVWLDPTLTSPYKFYQFFLNVSDEEAPRLLRVFTLLTQEEIEAIEAEHQQAPHLRAMQKALAKELTSYVHSPADYEKAVQASEILFGKANTEALAALDEATLLSVFEGVPQVEIPRSALGNDLGTLLTADTQAVIFSSKGELRRLVGEGGLSINGHKVAAIEQTWDQGLLQDRYLLVRKGKKNYYLVRISD